MSEQYDALLRNLSAPISVPQINNENDSMSIIRGVRNDASATLQSTHQDSSSHCSVSAPIQDVNEIENNASNASRMAPSRKDRMCANHPICMSMAKECGGWRSSHCSRLKNNKIVLPDAQTLARMKLQYKRNVDRVNKQKKRGLLREIG